MDGTYDERFASLGPVEGNILAASGTAAECDPALHRQHLLHEQPTDERSYERS